MYHTNAAYKQKVAELPQNFRMEIEIVFDESTGLTENGVIPPEDIFEAGLSENVFLNTFCVGSSVCTEFWVRIFNQNGKYKNDALATAEIHPKVTLYDASNKAVDTVSLGVFYVQQITIQDNDLRLACCDKMRLLEKAYAAKGTQISLLSVAQDIAQSVLANCLTVPADMPALNLLVDDTIFQGYTKRQVLELIAEAGGKFTAFDPDGNLCFKWFAESGVELSGDRAKEALELNGNTFSLDGNVVKVTGVRVVSEDTELVKAGTDSYLLTVNENPIAAAHPSEVAQYVLASMANTQYIPCKWQRIGGDPSLQVGDILTIVDNKETFDEALAESYERYPLFLSARSWTFNCGGFSDVYTASGDAERDLNTDRGMTVSKRLSQLAKRITETKSDLTAEMDDRQKALLLFNETIAGSLGLYTTYKTQADGSVILYMHDEQELEESQTIYTFGASGFAWTNDGWNEGSPVWQYGFDRNGNAILNAIYAYTLTADVITSGLLKSQNGASWINMNDGTFYFGHLVKTGNIDIDTGEAEYANQARLELEEGELRVYGTIRGTGENENLYLKLGFAEDAYSSLLFGDDNIGELFAIRSSINQSGQGTLWYSPIVSGKFGSNPKGIQFLPDGVNILNSGQSGIRLSSSGEAALQGENAWIRTYKDQINIVTSSGHKHIWFNYYSPLDTYAPGAVMPNAYDFGDGTNGGHAAVRADQIVCKYYPGGDTRNYGHAAILNGTVVLGNCVSGDNLYDYGDSYVLHVLGAACVNGVNVTSDPAVKNNIADASKLNATEKISQMKFYSYDYKDNAAPHVDIGTMAPEAPKEIQSQDGKAIDLYAYINLTAKAVQELNEKVEKQAQKISALEAEIAKMKK